MNSRVEALLEAIQQVKEKYCLSDRALCQTAGINPSTLSHIRSSKRNPGMKVLSALSQTFSELKDACHKCMDYPVDDIYRTPSQTAQNRILGLLRAIRHKLYLCLRAVKAR